MPAGKYERTDFGYIHYAERSSALKAVKDTEKYEIDGQLLEVVLAKPQTGKKAEGATLPLYLMINILVSDAICLNLLVTETKFMSKEIQNNVIVLANYVVVSKDHSHIPTISVKVMSSKTRTRQEIHADAANVVLRSRCPYFYEFECKIAPIYFKRCTPCFGDM